MFHSHFPSNKSRLYPQLTIRKITFCSSRRKSQRSVRGGPSPEDEHSRPAGQPGGQGPLPRTPPSYLLKKQTQNKQKPESRGPLDWEAAFEENQSLQEASWGFHVILLLHLGVQGGDKKGLQLNMNLSCPHNPPRPRCLLPCLRSFLFLSDPPLRHRHGSPCPVFNVSGTPLLPA